MVLEQLALLGIAGLDAYLVSTYLSSRKRAGERAKALSYQSPRLPAETPSPASTAPAAFGDSVVLSDRLSAIKDAVGETKFADEVLPYELGALPSNSLADACRLEETSEEQVSESSTVVESTSTTSSTVVEPVASSLEGKVESHERKMQDLNAGFAVLEYRIAEVERMLGVEKAEQPQKSEQIEIPFKPIIVQPVAVEKKAVTATKHPKKKKAKAKEKAARKAAKKTARVVTIAAKKAKPAARKKSARKSVHRKAVHKKASAKKAYLTTRTHVHAYDRLTRRATNRVELVIRNPAARKRKKRRKAAARKAGRVELVVRDARRQKKASKISVNRASNRVELVVKNAAKPVARKAAAKKKRKPAKATGRVELVVKSDGKAVAKKRRKASKPSNRVEVVVKTAGKTSAVRKRRASKNASNRVEVVLKEPSQKVEVVPVSSEQKPAEKKGTPNSKDHMDIEWKGSTIKLYSGETKD